MCEKSDDDAPGEGFEGLQPPPNRFGTHSYFILDNIIADSSAVRPTITQALVHMYYNILLTILTKQPVSMVL